VWIWEQDSRSRGRFSPGTWHHTAQVRNTVKRSRGLRGTELVTVREPTPVETRKFGGSASRALFCLQFEAVSGHYKWVPCVKVRIHVLPCRTGLLTSYSSS
jgi:hypothetical protein